MASSLLLAVVTTVTPNPKAARTSSSADSGKDICSLNPMDMFPVWSTSFYPVLGNLSLGNCHANQFFQEIIHPRAS